MERKLLSADRGGGTMIRRFVSLLVRLAGAASLVFAAVPQGGASIQSTRIATSRPSTPSLGAARDVAGKLNVT